MPAYRTVRLTLEYPKELQDLHDHYAEKYHQDLTNPVDDDSDKLVMNGRKVRILQTMATIPHFAYTSKLHKVRLNEEDLAEIENEMDTASSGSETDKESEHLADASTPSESSDASETEPAPEPAKKTKKRKRGTTDSHTARSQARKRQRASKTSRPTQTASDSDDSLPQRPARDSKAVASERKTRK